MGQKKFAAILADVAAQKWHKATLGAKTKDGLVKYKYLSLSDILDRLQPIIAANGCSLQCTVHSEDDSNNTVVAMACVDNNTGANVAFSRAKIPQCGDAQAFGSWLTYMRRYLICAIFNIVADDDDGAATLPKKILPKGNYEKAAIAVVSGRYGLNDIWRKYPDTPYSERAIVAQIVEHQKQPQQPQQQIQRPTSTEAHPHQPWHDDLGGLFETKQ